MCSNCNGCGNGNVYGLGCLCSCGVYCLCGGKAGCNGGCSGVSGARTGYGSCGNSCGNSHCTSRCCNPGLLNLFLCCKNASSYNSSANSYGCGCLNTNSSNSCGCSNANVVSGYGSCRAGIPATTAIFATDGTGAIPAGRRHLGASAGSLVLQTATAEHGTIDLRGIIFSCLCLNRA